MSADQTREGWLRIAAKALGEWLAAEGEEVPDVHVSVGFPGGTANRKKTIGQCWARSESADEVNQIFISPIQGEENSRDVLGTLLHELIHAVDDCRSGHKGEFARIARAMGFLTKLTQSGNRTAELDERLDGLVERLGPFPHAALAMSGRGSESPKKQEARMIKLTCPDDGYIVRTTRKWLDIGTPSCPCGADLLEAS